MIRRVLRRVQSALARRLGPSVVSVQGLDDRAFLERVDFRSASGASVDGLLEYFARRTGDAWPELPSELTDLRLNLMRMTDQEIIDRADAALAGDLHPSGLRPRFVADGLPDWSYNPADSREWLLMLHRHAWWPLWGKAYRISGDEKYVHAFVAQLEHWIANNPLPKYKSEHMASWRLMETGLRMRISWIPSFGCFSSSTAFTAAARLKMLRAIYDHGQFLQTFYTNRNHLLRESNGLLATGLTFPEFDRSADWVEAAAARLVDELHAQVNRDGSHLEMSVGYQWLTIIEFEITRALLGRGGREAAIDGLDSTLRKMYELLAAVIRPDGTFPQLNDGFLLWGADRLIETAQQRGWDDIVYAASAGESGAAPDFCSRSFPNAGLHIMRSDWTRDARYLVADTGPYGGPHGHEDKLSFELAAYGAQFIVDPGSYTYSRDDPFRNYFVGSQGHNTVLVDNCSQVRRWNERYMTPEVEDVVHGAWRGDGEIDAASGHYDEGYAEFAILRPADAQVTTGVTHQRDFVFAKPDYWVVADHLASGDTHDYAFLFHLAPDAVVETLSPTAALIRSSGNGAGLVIHALTDHEMSAEEIEGWFSEDHHKKFEAPVVRFGIAQASSAFVAWVLYPLAPGADAAEIRATLDYDEVAGERTVSVQRADHRDILRLPAGTAAGRAEAAARMAQVSIARGA